MEESGKWSCKFEDIFLNVKLVSNINEQNAYLSTIKDIVRN